MKHFLHFLFLLAATAIVPAHAGDVSEGEALHEAHCVACHSSLTGGDPDSLYTRSDRNVNSLDGLRKQVQRCELNLGLRWFDDEIANVTAYLNQRFYHFD